jgi:hypothetical protein
MSINSGAIRKAGPFSGNGSTVSFPFTFKVFQASDLYVVQTDPTGIETVQTLTAQYTVTLNSNQDSNPGGSVVMITAPATGYLLTLGSQVSSTQPLVLTNTGGFYPTVINDAFDRVTILVQQLLEQMSRAVLVNFSSSITPSTFTNYIVAIYNNLAAIIGVNSNATNINAVNANSANINTVAGNNTNVTNVGGNITNVNTVAGISANVTSVAGNATNINTVAANNANITTVAGVSANVTTVAGNTTNINTVATNIAAVNNVSTNMTAVTNAVASASAAATSATNAASSATSASTSATNAASSATAAASSASSASTSATTATTQASAASSSATAAASSASSASTSATSASTSATNASTSATNAATSYTTFNNQYLGSKAADPTLNNTGGALVDGNLYWNSVSGVMKVYSIASTSWSTAYAPSGNYVQKSGDTMTGLLTLSGAPTANLHAATKQYVDGAAVASAAKWTTARTETLAGDVTGSASVDGSANWSIATTLAASGVTAGTYNSVTVDAKGRVTAGTNVATGVPYATVLKYQ